MTTAQSAPSHPGTNLTVAGRTVVVTRLASDDPDDISIVELKSVDGRSPEIWHHAGVEESSGPWCRCRDFMLYHEPYGTLCPCLEALAEADWLGADIATDRDGVVVGHRRTPEPVGLVRWDAEVGEFVEWDGTEVVDMDDSDGWESAAEFDAMERDREGMVLVGGGW